MSMALPYGDEEWPCVTVREMDIIREFTQTSELPYCPEYTSDCVFFDECSLAIYPVRQIGENIPDPDWVIMECYDPQPNPTTLGLYEEPEWREIAEVTSLKKALKEMLKIYKSRQDNE